MVAYFVELVHQPDPADLDPFCSRAYAVAVVLDSLVLPLYHLVMASLVPLEDVMAWQHHQLMDDLNSDLELDLDFVNVR